MSDETLWFGFLEAGEKSSLVVLDSRLSTGQPDTVYVYNHKRGTILEYKRAIAEAKLRELSDEERAEVRTLRSAYRKARRGFTPRGTAIRDGSAAAPKASPAAVRAPIPEVEYEEYDADFDDALDMEPDDSAAA